MGVRGRIKIRTSAVLTGSYVAATAVNCRMSQTAILFIKYTMGASESANGIAFKVEWSMDGGTTYYTDANFYPNADAITTGAITIDKNEFTYLADSAAESYDYIAVPIQIYGEIIKVSFKESGTVSSNVGTCEVYLGFVE